MTVNQSKVRELTEDWLHRWRSVEPDDSNNPPRSNDIGVQTSFPINKEDPADLIPMKETLWQKDEVTQKMETDSEAGAEWSDDSLDGYNGQRWSKKTTSKYYNTKPTKESNAAESVGSSYASSFWSEQSPIIHGHGINVRNNKSGDVPDVKTIFSYSREEDEQSSTLTPPSSDKHLSRAPIYYSHVGKFPSSSSPISPPNNIILSADELLTRLNTLIDKLRINECNNSNQTSSVNLPHYKFCHKRNHCHHCHCKCRTHHSLLADQPSFESVMRAELLAIRRRMVAKTASPKVAQTLSYLTSTKNYVSYYEMYDTFNTEDGNLPGEIWV